MKKMLTLGGLAWVACTLAASAGSFTSDFSNPNQTGFTLNGGTRADGVSTYPTIESGHLVLTYNEVGMQGAIVLDDLDNGSPIESFTLNCKLQIGPGSGNPADGLAICFGPDITSSSNFSEEGTGNGLIVAFDIYDNGSNEAPAIDVKYGGNTIAHTLFAKADLVTSKFEDLSIQMSRGGALTVTWKGQPVYRNLIIPDYAPSAGQFAIGARTGDENAMQWVDDLQVTTVKAGAITPPSITVQPQNTTVAERGTATFSIEFDGSAPLTFKWYKNGNLIADATNVTLTLTRVPFADNNAKIKAEVSNSAGAATSQEATLTVIKDTTPASIVSVEGSVNFTNVTVTFSEPVSTATAQAVGNYQINGLTVTAAVLSPMPNDNKVLLTTARQTDGTEYTLSVQNVQDTAGNAVASGTQAKFFAYSKMVGGLRFEAWFNITGSAVQGLLDDPRYPDSPDQFGYVTQFTSRLIYPDSSHENYGARISGWIVPAETGQYEFFIRSDDASQLYLSSDDKMDNAVMIAEETGCCGPFEEPGAPETSAPIALTAGKQYAIYALVKDGTGGDYLDVAWRKVGDTTSPRALPYIPGSVLYSFGTPGTFTAPVVAFTAPSEGSVFDTNVPVTLTVSASATAPKTLTLVEFFEMGKKLGEATQSPYSLTITNFSADPHKIVARATDSAGIFTETLPLTVNIGKPTEQLVLVAIDDKTTWRYDRSGQDLGTAWREMSYNDAAWPQGKALIADETTTTVEPIRTAISRFNDAGEYVKTFYFRTKFTFDRPIGPWVKLQLRHVVDDGAVIYLNGKEINRFGIAAGPVDATTDASGHENAWEGPYEISATNLVQGENILTAEVHNSGGSSSDMVFGAELVATIQLTQKQLDLVKIDDQTLWRYDRSGQDLGEAWRARTFNDSQWPQGKALIADETTTTVEPIRTAISRFNEAGDYVKTFYFRTHFNVPSFSTNGAKLKLRHVVDDGVVFYLNGTEINRFGIAAGPVDATTDASGHENAWEGPFDIPIQYLLSGDNVLAAEVHQSGGSSSDMVFGAELVATLLVPATTPEPTPAQFTKITRSGANCVIEWTGSGTLQSADGLTGTYTDISTATSPYTTPISGLVKFYRLRQ